MEHKSLSRQKLYELVWSEPINSLSGKFNITDYQLRKICKEYRIPLPGNGYWVRKRFGKKIDPRPLPQDNSLNERIRFPFAGQQKPLSPVEQLMIEIESSGNPYLKVPDQLKDPHRLIISARRILKDKTNFDQYEDLIGTGRFDEELRIRVAPASVDRALRFMDTFIKLLESRGHKIDFRYRHSCAVVFGEYFEFRLTELRKRGKARFSWHDNDLWATGILKFELEINYSSRIFQDSRILIEERLPKIIALLEIDGEIKRKRSIRREAVKKIEEEKKEG